MSDPMTMTNDEAHDFLASQTRPEDVGRLGAAIRAIRAKAIADAKEWERERLRDEFVDLAPPAVVARIAVWRLLGGIDDDMPWFREHPAQPVQEDAP